MTSKCLHMSDADEARRLAVLRSYCVLDTGCESRFDDLTNLAAAICGTPVSLVSLVDTERLYFKSAHGLSAREIPRTGGFCDYAIRQEGIFEVMDAQKDPRFAEHPLVTNAPHMRFYAAAPLVTSKGYALGTLCVIDFVPRQLEQQQMKMLLILSRQVMAQLEMTLQAIRDPLTKLYNRRQLEDSLHREFLRARRSGMTVGIMSIDIDHFKRINDSFGHETGDGALKAIAAKLGDCVREEDITCRAGGEEFVIILPGMEEGILWQRAEMIRATIEQARNLIGKNSSQITVSIGLASFPTHGDSQEAVMRAADAALYQAKSQGRNRIVMGAPSDTPRRKMSRSKGRASARHPH